MFLFAENSEVRSNRIDARAVDKDQRRVTLLEIRSSWIENREQNQEKTSKYAPLRWEMSQQFPGYTISQHNIIVDVLGGYSKATAESVRELVGAQKADDVLARMQKAAISSTLNVARTFKF